jgi:hypothetical protein
MTEFVFRRELGLDDGLARCGMGFEELGQAVIGLGAEDEVDGLLAAHDLLAFGLCHAAGDRDHRP